MEEAHFRHYRQVMLTRKGDAVDFTICTASPEMPGFADALSRDIAAALAHHGRKSGAMPRAVTLDYTAPQGDAAPAEVTALIEPIQPRFSLDDFLCEPEFRAVIDDLLFFAENFPAIRLRLKTHSITRGVLINFFGHSGTGKTMLVEAIAAALHKDLFVLNYANVESALVGKTPKNIADAFRGLDGTRAILMLDEADAFVSNRIANLRQGAEYALNAARSQIIREIDKFEGLIFLATNLFGTYDPAILRRIKFNLHFDLPGPHAARRMYTAFLPPDLLQLDDPARLAEQAAGLSGGDIQNTCEIIVMRALQLSEAGQGALPLGNMLDIIRTYRQKFQPQMALPPSAAPTPEPQARPTP